ncbi:hypothetical protein [Antribacter gilvus]|uniref:hypothetical protein n=1 Tax=Antribacter gilvus TaxID=2304675 RepID=UPI000F7783FC|nr:hypothetical protein [Antribacter gilvus]
MSLTTTARRILAALTTPRPAPAPVPAVEACAVRLMVWDVWDEHLEDGIFHLDPPCGAPAMATVHAYCPECGAATAEPACAECAGHGATAPLNFDATCPSCAHPAAHYAIRPL